MLEGGYEFKTASRELMQIHSGKLNVKIAGDKYWRLITGGMDFIVPKILHFVERF